MKNYAELYLFSIKYLFFRRKGNTTIYFPSLFCYSYPNFDHVLEINLTKNGKTTTTIAGIIPVITEFKVSLEISVISLCFIISTNICVISLCFYISTNMQYINKTQCRGKDDLRLFLVPKVQCLPTCFRNLSFIEDGNHVNFYLKSQRQI